MKLVILVLAVFTVAQAQVSQDVLDAFNADCLKRVNDYRAQHGASAVTLITNQAIIDAANS